MPTGTLTVTTPGASEEMRPSSRVWTETVATSRTASPDALGSGPGQGVEPRVVAGIVAGCVSVVVVATLLAWLGLGRRRGRLGRALAGAGRRRAGHAAEAVSEQTRAPPQQGHEQPVELAADPGQQTRLAELPTRGGGWAQAPAAGGHVTAVYELAG